MEKKTIQHEVIIIVSTTSRDYYLPFATVEEGEQVYQNLKAIMMDDNKVSIEYKNSTEEFFITKKYITVITKKFTKQGQK